MNTEVEPTGRVTGGDGDTPSRPSFRADVQGLRTVAVALVVIYHSGVGLPGGFLGVDVFFVISGFVIGRLLLAEQAATGRIALGRFYARRIRRLVPALTAVLVFVAVVSVAATSPFGEVRRMIGVVGIGAVFYGANIALLTVGQDGYFDLDATTNPLLHTWTLAVEEQFYLVLPLLLIALGAIGRRRGRPARVVVVGVASVAVASFLAGAVLSGSVRWGSDDALVFSRLAFYSAPTRMWEFLAGVFLALLGSRLGRIGARAAVGCGAVGLAAIGGAANLLTETTPTPGWTTMVPVVGAACVIVAGAGRPNVISRGLSGRGMVWIGDRSYGWYLWHWPFMVFARFSFPTMSTWAVLAVGVAALVPTELSYRWLEQPIRRGTGWSGRRVVGLAAGCSGLAAAGLIVLWTVPAVGSAGTGQVERSLEPAFDLDRSCLTVGRDDEAGLNVHCTWPVPEPRGTIVFVGDSHAGALAEVMAATATRAGYELSVAYRPGCAFADVERVYSDRRRIEGCRDFLDTTLRRIELVPPDLVVMASRQDFYLRSDRFPLRDPVTDAVGRSEPTRAAIFERGLQRTLQRLSDRNIPAVVLATVPELAPFDLDLCPAWRLWVRPESCARTLPRAVVDEHRRVPLTATRAAVDRVDGVTLVDFADDLCPAGTCSSYRDGWWLYEDSNHLSRHGASTLAPRIEAEVLVAVGGTT